MPVISRTNLCTNPSFETSTAGWSATGTTAPTLTQSAVQSWPLSGSKALRVAWSTTNTASPAAGTTFTTTIGLVYTCSTWVYVPNGAPPVYPYVSTTLGAASQTFGQWERIFVTFTATATSHVFNLGPKWVGSIPASTFAYVDAVLCEQSSSLLAYFDGDVSGGSWTGTAELSTSSLPSFNTDPTVPTMIVEFDARAPQPGDFILDSSLLNGADVLVQFPRYVQVTTDVYEVVVTRGRQDPNQPVQAGTAKVSCFNITGNFDPDNLNSPYNQQPGAPQLTRGMLGRISASFPSGSAFTQQTVFTGRLDSVDLDKGYEPTSVLTFVDDMVIAGQTAMPSYNTAVRAEPSGTRAAWLESLLPVSGTPSISAYLTRNLLPTYGGGSVLDMLNTVATAEQGRVFVDRFGNMTVTAHGDEYNQTVLAALTDNTNIVSGVGYETIVTSSGTLQVVAGALVDRYNRNDNNYPTVMAGNTEAAQKGGAVVSVIAPLASDSDAQSLANYLASKNARPTPRINSLTVNFVGQPAAALLLLAELGKRVTASRTVVYTTGSQTTNLQLSIEGVTWAANAITGRFDGTFYTAPTDAASLYGGAGIFTLDTSLLDGVDVLAPY